MLGSSGMFVAETIVGIMYQIYTIVKGESGKKTCFCIKTRDHLRLPLETAAAVGINRISTAVLEGVLHCFALHNWFILA